MPSTRPRLHPASLHPASTVLLTIALTFAGSTAVMRAAHDESPTTTIQSADPVQDDEEGPGGVGLDAIETDAARKLAELRAQWSADLSCRGPNYPARPC